MKTFVTISSQILNPIWVIGSLAFGSCGIITQPDISDERFVVIAPNDSIVLDGNTVSFWWELVDGATGYELNVVSPDFDQLQTIVERRTIADPQDQFDLTVLDTGSYAWRLRGWNETSFTEWVEGVFRVDSTGGIADASVVLSSPSDGLFTRFADVDLAWEEVNGADGYRLRWGLVGAGTWLGDVNLLEPDYLLEGLSEGTYNWEVRAEDDQGFTAYSSRTFTVDQTPPDASTLFSPADGAFVSLSDSLTWIPSTGSVRDSVFIYSDAGLTLVSWQETLMETAIGLDGILSTGSTYWWRLRSIDAAGNVSGWSEVRSFILN